MAVQRGASRCTVKLVKNGGNAVKIRFVNRMVRRDVGISIHCWYVRIVIPGGIATRWDT